MRSLKMLVIILTAMVTQSCRIEMPSLVELIKDYKPYNMSKSQALKAQSGFKDTLIIGDFPESGHGESMFQIITELGTQEKNIVFFSDFRRIEYDGESIGLRLLTSGEHEVLRKAARVVHIPTDVLFSTQKDIAKVLSTDILFILAAGNMHDSFMENRNMYSPGHIYWREPFWWKGGSISYEHIRASRNTGKVLTATSAQVTEDGMVEPLQEVVSCGDIKESCFTMLPIQSTSRASAHLAAISFYLSQFWETPEEVVEVLKECAIDVGEPGVDREFGNGVVNLLCPRVLKKEVEVVSGYLEDTRERGEILQGGELAGMWKAESTALQVHIPRSLKEVLQAEAVGEVTGTVEFKGNRMIADVATEATVRVVFLLKEPIEARAEEVLQFEEAYTVDQGNTLNIGEKFFTYTATKDSLHLVQSYTLNEVLALLPDPLGSMVDMASPDFFVDNPIQLRMSFAKVVKDILLGDFDEDGTVGISDFLLFTNAFGASRGEASFNELFDLVPDGIINVADFLVFVDQFGKTRDS